ncbi:hypothetical protein FRC01_012693 [Tulasnella sp. 417]|nr:hypothetical protein FRC01_012693 [Tulasnella sp. 417]
MKPILYGIAGQRLSVRREVNAPGLETLSCHTHLITPESPIRLSSLLLTRVDIIQSGQRPVELPHLVDLRIEECDPVTILSTFLTPSLRRLAAGTWRRSNTPLQLPRYDSLQELRWLDIGNDPVLGMFCRLCPNLKRYFDYVEADDSEDIEIADSAYRYEFLSEPTILGVFDEDMPRGENTYRHWPVLEEVSLNSASCDHVATLIKAVPSIKRVRILRHPVRLCDEDNQEGEMDKLAMLREKVEIAIGREPWGSGNEE